MRVFLLVRTRSRSAVPDFRVTNFRLINLSAKQVAVQNVRAAKFAAITAWSAEKNPADTKFPPAAAKTDTMKPFSLLNQNVSVIARRIRR